MLTIPDIDPLINIELIGGINMFKNGRGLTVWLALVFRQSPNDGQPRFLGISKRGDSYLRTLLIHGASFILQHAEKNIENKPLY
ncbi:transposase [Pseudomonadota bacterium]